MNNPAIVIGKDSIVLIDPGSSYKIGKAVLAQIKTITNKPIAAVFNTHVHGDHWLGNQAVVEQYPNVKIYAHPMMIARAKEGEGDRWLRIMKNATNGFTKDTKVVYPTNSTAHLQIIKIGSETFRIHNPTEKAHTNTDIMIEHINSKTLFLGDNDLVNRLGRFDETADIHSNIKVLQYAINLNLEHYVPGHGPSGNADSAVKPFLNYLLILKEVTNNGYDNDLLDYEVKPFADARLKAYKNWNSYDTQLGRHINKLMTEMEASYE